MWAGDISDISDMFQDAGEVVQMEEQLPSIQEAPGSIQGTTSHQEWEQAPVI